MNTDSEANGYSVRACVRLRVLLWRPNDMVTTIITTEQPAISGRRKTTRNKSNWRQGYFHSNVTFRAALLNAVCLGVSAYHTVALTRLSRVQNKSPISFINII